MSTPTAAEIHQPGSIQAARDRLARLESDYPRLRAFARTEPDRAWQRRANAMLNEIANLRWRVASHDRKNA